MVVSLQHATDRANELPNQTISVAVAEDREVLLALEESYHLGVCNPILVGDEQKIRKIATENDVDINNFEIVNEHNHKTAANKAVQLVSDGDADILMKGKVQTRDLLKAVLNKEKGLRTGRMLSHIAILDVLAYDKLLFLTDAAMNIAPDVKEKCEILQNAVEICTGLEIYEPKSALLAAVENINQDMEATLDAAVLAKMGDRGQISGTIVDGPLALDNAISVDAAEQKGVTSSVAGRADILLVPRIEMGNAIYKSMTHLAKSEVAGIIAGASAPIVLTSRADPHESKAYSIALASIIAFNKNQ